MTSYDLTLAGEGDISSERTYGWTGSRGTGNGRVHVCSLYIHILSSITDIWELSAFAKASEQSVPSKVCTWCNFLYCLSSLPFCFFPMCSLMVKLPCTNCEFVAQNIYIYIAMYF